MAKQRPQITAAFIVMSLEVRGARGQSLITPSVLAMLTNTSQEYWEQLEASGEGPRYVRYRGHDWFNFGEVQDWLVANICEDTEVGDA